MKTISQCSLIEGKKREEERKRNKTKNNIPLTKSSFPLKYMPLHFLLLCHDSGIVFKSYYFIKWYGSVPYFSIVWNSLSSNRITRYCYKSLKCPVKTPVLWFFCSSFYLVIFYIFPVLLCKFCWGILILLRYYSGKIYFLKSFKGFQICTQSCLMSFLRCLLFDGYFFFVIYIFCFDVCTSSQSFSLSWVGLWLLIKYFSITKFYNCFNYTCFSNHVLLFYTFFIFLCWYFINWAFNHFCH